MGRTLTSRELQDQSRVLVLDSPSRGGTGDGPCVAMATDRPADGRVLVIAYERAPGAVVADWQASDETPVSLAVIGPDEGEFATSTHANVYVTHVVPDDLTGIEVAVGRYLDRWSGASVTVCVDSVTSLLQHVDEDRLFRFLHTVTGLFVAADAAGHVHLDPSVHDDRTVATLATLFDTVVRRVGDEWRVERI